jgi:chemotaxis protein histidine kinase CheA
MSGGAPGFLEFFILEASDYVEQLDGLLLGGDSTGPDAASVQRVARALRGTATMAKIPSFADLAGGVERVGRAMQDGALRWDPALGGALVAAIDDLKTLLHGARTWSPTDDQRATARSAELERYAPVRPIARAAQPSPESSQPAAGESFLATEAANIAAGLELLTTRAGDADTAANVLRRVRALRGVAGVKEVVPLADALEGTEDAARGLESADEDLTDEARQLLGAAADYLRSISTALRAGADVHAPSMARDAFAVAQDRFAGRETDREIVVPISDLFYADGAPGVLETSQHPPTSASERFHLELVSLGEHLRQVVDAARRAADTASRSRVKRDLRRALRAVHASAESFGERDVAQFVAAHLDAAENVDFLGLSSLDDLASVLTDSSFRGERLSARLQELVSGRDLTADIGGGFAENEPPAAVQSAEPDVSDHALQPRNSVQSVASVASASPSALEPPFPSSSHPEPSPLQPLPVAARVDTHAGEILDQSAAALIDSSIAALENMTPFSQPVPLPEDTVVPIESLLYRGRAALDRAVEIRDDLRRRPAPADATALEELFDLLELARAE